MSGQPSENEVHEDFCSNSSVLLSAFSAQRCATDKKSTFVQTCLIRLSKVEKLAKVEFVEKVDGLASPAWPCLLQPPV
jgi:hypothetical protein